MLRLTSRQLDTVHPLWYTLPPMTLRELRESFGWSVRDLAGEAVISKSMVAMVESGERDPSLSTVRRLAEALGIKPAELVALIEDEHA